MDHRQSEWLPTTHKCLKEKENRKDRKVNRKNFFSLIPMYLKTKKRKAGLNLCFGCLSGQIGKNRLLGVVGRDVGFGCPNQDRPDEIGTVPTRSGPLASMDFTKTFFKFFFSQNMYD